MGERQGANNAGGAVERVTIAEAATLLGCHPNTVRNRVKAGIYRAEKVLTENGPTWMIERNSLTNNPPTTARQQPVVEVPLAQQEAIQELARAIVREAGLQPASVAEMKRRSMKSYSDSLKHTSTVAGAAVVGVLLLQQTLGLLDTQAVVVTVVVAGISFSSSLLGVMSISGWMALNDHQLEEYPERGFYWLTFISAVLLILVVILLIAGAVF